MNNTNEYLIRNELIATTNNKHYNGWSNRTKYGYHSYDIEDIHIPGQRNPRKRLEIYKKYVDFHDVILYDFGCNVGAMLHHLPEINTGIGFDYDAKCILAGNNISKILKLENKIKLYHHDFDKDSYLDLKEKIKPNDISLLLSLGSWVASWKDLYSIALEYSKKIILEINNIKEGEPQLNFFQKKQKQITQIADNSNDDSTGNSERQSFLIS